MQFKRSRRLVVCAVSALAVLGGGCKSAPPAELPFSSAQGSVGFDVTLESRPSDPQKPTRWLATYKSGSHTAQFRIELDSPQQSASTKPVGVSFGKGRFVAIAGSDNSVLMVELKKALEAKTLPTRTTRADSVQFTYAIIGGDLYRQADGGLTGDRKGNWAAIKLFLGNGESEVYLNLNSALGKGEFSIKDPEYGDSVVSDLAKVL
jgi:hypothetical protein